MEPEEFANITVANDTEFGSELRYIPPSNFALVPAVVVNVAAIVADVLIIYLIAKFKNLHTITNWYLLNWRTCNVMFLVLSPINFMVLAHVSFVLKETACVWFIELFVTYVGNILFIVGLTVDWYMSHFASRYVPVKVRNCFKLEIVLIWIVIAILSVCLCFGCVLRHLLELGLITHSTYLIFVLIICILKFVKLRTCVDGKSNLALILAVSYVFCWLPNYILHVVKWFNHDLEIPYEITALIELVGYSNSIVIIIGLYRYDKNFQTSFKCLCHNREDLSVSESSYESIDLNKPGEVHLLA